MANVLVKKTRTREIVCNVDLAITISEMTISLAAKVKSNYKHFLHCEFQESLQVVVFGIT
jgi:hypothetical protein